MTEMSAVSQKALKYDVQVMQEGRVELQVPFPPGARVTVVVVQETQDVFDELLQAAESSLDFWDNLLDDEDWSDA